MDSKFKAEILAPVGSREMLYAAVRSGADAVYLGAKDFSARRNAENFSVGELKEVIEYCHIRGVKVYLTLNILIKEAEMPSAFALAQEAYNAGVDGVIIADIGLASVLHREIPDLKLHASTQLSVHSPSALPLLKALGFCQVVVAREMSREDLKEFCAKARKLSIKVEAFVHGALCMSVSGQCLLSAFLGSRSGNRGLCAGPCRLPFKAPNGTGYDLSLKDLSLLKYAKEMLELGVESFKIEGRMKRPEYVAAATYSLRQALEGELDRELDTTLKNVFSRSGFTAGYYENRLGKEMFGIRTKEDVVSADSVFPKLHELYRKERKNIPLKIKADILCDKPITLTLTDCDNNSVTVKGSPAETAQNKPLTIESLNKNLLKFGNTPYSETECEINLDDGLFVTAGAINELRRQAVEALDLKRSELNRPKSNIVYKEKLNKNSPCAKQLLVRIENDSQIPENLSGISAIVFPLEQNPEKVAKLGIPLIADIPRGIVSEKAMRERLTLFKNYGFKKALCGNLSAIKIAKDLGLEIIGDIGLNIANGESVNCLSDFGVKETLISCEQTASDINSIPADIKIGIVAYGHIPLMLFKNCPIKNGTVCAKCNKSSCLTDRLGTKFPVRCRGGYSELLNSVPLWLADKADDFDCDFLLLYFTSEPYKTVENIIEAYKNGLPPQAPHTRGLYYRGTI